MAGMAFGIQKLRHALGFFNGSNRMPNQFKYERKAVESDFVPPTLIHSIQIPKHQLNLSEKQFSQNKFHHLNTLHSNTKAPVKYEPKAVELHIVLPTLILSIKIPKHQLNMSAKRFSQNKFHHLNTLHSNTKAPVKYECKAVQ